MRTRAEAAARFACFAFGARCGRFAFGARFACFAFGALALAACDAGSLKIALQISDGPVQACPSAAVPPAPTCGDVPIACEAVLDLRVVRPAAPGEAYFSLCEPLPLGAERNLCAMEMIDLPARDLPKETLEVQVMIWPREAIAVGPGGGLACDRTVGFGVQGFPEEVAPAPALGGRAFFRPGDTLTVVPLGCTDLGALNQPSCSGQIELRTGVNSFDPPYGSVSRTVAADLGVSVGEPRYDASRGEHDWRSIKALDDEPPDPQQPAPPRWSGAVEALAVEDALCVQVNDAATGESTLHCEPVPAGERTLALTGYAIPPARRAQILAGLGLSDVPREGLTLGVLLDQSGAPAAGYRIETSPAETVLYLTAAHQVVPGGTTTTSSGLFVARQAPYGATFRAHLGSQAPVASGIGGRVADRLTIVVLRVGKLATPG